MFRSVLSLLLGFALWLSLSASASQGGPAPQKPIAVQQQQSSDSVLQSSSRQPDSQTSPANGDRLTLTGGTPVRLKFTRAVISSQVIAGKKVPLEVVEPVLVSNFLVIPKRTSAEAMVTVAQAGRSVGRGGNLELKIENVRLADGELVPVRAVKDVQGGGRKAAFIATYPVWPFDVKGKSATIPAGAEITAYIAGDFSLDPSKFQTAGTNPQEKNGSK